MSDDLPDLDPATFAAAVRPLSPRPLTDRALERLWIHYTELVRWGDERTALEVPVGEEGAGARAMGELLHRILV